jgi:ketosteroid isomerase-like protein
MKKHGTIVFIVGMLFSYSVLKAQSKHHLDEAKDAIGKSNAIYFNSFVNNDPSIFIDRYAKDACIMPPGTLALCCTEAVSSFFKTAYTQHGLRNGKFITTNIYGGGKEFVMEEGLWQSFNAEGKLFDDGKYLVLWKKTPEGWKMFRDSFSSNHIQK